MTELRTNPIDIPRTTLRVYTPEQAAEVLQCSRRFLVDKANAGELPCLHLNQSTLRFTTDHLMAIIHATEQIPERFKAHAYGTDPLGAAEAEPAEAETVDMPAVEIESSTSDEDDIYVSEHDIELMPGLNRRSKVRMAKMAARAKKKEQAAAVARM